MTDVDDVISESNKVYDEKEKEMEIIKKKKKYEAISGSHKLSTDKGKNVEAEVIDIEEEALYDEAMDGVYHYFPSKHDPQCIKIHERELACLAPEGYLSDSIISFCATFLFRKSKTDKFHLFSSFFYSRLSGFVYGRDSFERLRRWWNRCHLMDKSYLLITINEDHHWSLVIACLPSNKNDTNLILLHLDSMRRHNTDRICESITKLLNEEGKVLTNNGKFAWKVYKRRVPVPRQKNASDCGLFVLCFIEHFIKEAPSSFSKNDVSMFSRKWFEGGEATILRMTIYSLLNGKFGRSEAKEAL